MAVNVSNKPVVMPGGSEESQRTHVDRVYGREKLPVWAQLKLRGLEANFDLTGTTAFLADEDTMVLVAPEQFGEDSIQVEVHKEPRPYGGMEDSLTFRRIAWE